MYWKSSKIRSVSSLRRQTARRQNSPMLKLQALLTPRSRRLFLRCMSVLLTSAILAAFFYHLPSLLLEIAFFPAHGYLLPGAIPDISPSVEYVREKTVEAHPPFPRIVHVTYKSREELPKEWEESLEEWKVQNPSWEVKFWSDEDIIEFVEGTYPDYLDMFNRYKYTIQKVDAVRYMILHAYGGLYSDLDIYPARSLDLLLEQFEEIGKNVILAKTLNAGLTNAFMASVPKSPFMNCVVQNLPRYQHRFYHFIGWRHWEVLSSAGSTFLWGSYGRCHDDGVGVLSAESFRACSVCDSWGRHSPPGEDWCDTDWLRHSATNSSWHESKSLLHTIWFACTMFLFCSPYRACFLLAFLIVVVAKNLREKRRRRQQNRRERLPLTVEETEPLTGMLGPWIEMT